MLHSWVFGRRSLECSRADGLLACGRKQVNIELIGSDNKVLMKS